MNENMHELRMLNSFRNGNISLLHWKLNYQSVINIENENSIKFNAYLHRMICVRSTEETSNFQLSYGSSDTVSFGISEKDFIQSMQDRSLSGSV